MGLQDRNRLPVNKYISTPSVVLDCTHRLYLYTETQRADLYGKTFEFHR